MGKHVFKCIFKEIEDTIALIKETLEGLTGSTTEETPTASTEPTTSTEPTESTEPTTEPTTPTESTEPSTEGN